jgi:hypothetical protein
VYSSDPDLVVLLNWDPDAVTEPGFPPGGSKLDVTVTSREMMEERPSGAVDVKVGGLTGWQISKGYDSAAGIGVAKVHQVVLYEGERAIAIIQRWSDPSADETNFWRVVNSFELLGVGDAN